MALAVVAQYYPAVSRSCIYRCWASRRATADDDIFGRRGFRFRVARLQAFPPGASADRKLARSESTENHCCTRLATVIQ